MNVRDQLRTEDPFLHEALERSWRIAHENWLPAIGTSHGSHNAYPHLHNMELRLNDLAEAFGGGERRPAFRLSPAEKYLLLAAILFHDIGRGSKKPEHKDHAFGSFNLLMEGTADRWATYGIPDRSLARIIAKLALHHAPADRDSTDESRNARRDNRLSERTVDPFGRVRETGLLAVLVLLDHLDTSYIRVIPPEFGTGPKGFRRCVHGVGIEVESRLVCSVLAGFDDEESEDDARREGPPAERALDHYALGRPYKNEEQAILQAVAAGTRPPILSDDLVYGQKVAVVQGDLESHRKALRDNHALLYAMGITLDDWLLEFEEHLFDSGGSEVWEPIFDPSYLRRVASEMWKLSGQVFGRAIFTYDTLAAAVREPDVTRIRQAVKRLSVLTDDLPLTSCESEESEARGALEAHDLWWRWRVEGESRRHCRCVRFEKVRQRLETLDEQRAKAKQHLDEVVAPKAGGPS